MDNKNNLELKYAISGAAQLVYGVDEAGRGPLAGPVVAAAVKVDDLHNIDIRDSKKLSPLKHEKSAKLIKNYYDYGIGIIHNETIDEINILNATFKAMLDALSQCNNYLEHYVLFDGNMLPKNFIGTGAAVIKGDQKFLSIAAASIIAKQKRDEIMNELSQEFPEYEWDKNKGYPTKRHIELIKLYGACKYHRKSFLTKILK